MISSVNHSRQGDFSGIFEGNSPTLIATAILVIGVAYFLLQIIPGVSNRSVTTTLSNTPDSTPLTDVLRAELFAEQSPEVTETTEQERTLRVSHREPIAMARVSREELSLLLKRLNALNTR